uniref:THAP domain-containing protein 1 n=1 Tax=Oryzias sinensis TaxID=183150 RepID=A0A8C7X3F7_9TELE
MSGFRVKERRSVFQRVTKTSQHCCVPLCANYSKYNSTISFHSFPVDVSVRAEWMVRVQREDFIPIKTSRVCSRHFQKGDFVNNPRKLRKLKKGAIPTFFSWNDFQIPAPRASVRATTHIKCCSTKSPPYKRKSIFLQVYIKYQK